MTIYDWGTCDIWTLKDFFKIFFFLNKIFFLILFYLNKNVFVFM